MSEILVDYHRIHLTTWGYLSSLLLIGLFFKFNRFWSVRNLDLVFLILLAPGLLLVQVGYREKTLLLHRLPAATLPENGDSGSGADLQTTSEEPESEPTPDIANLNSIDPPGADGADNLVLNGMTLDKFNRNSVARLYGLKRPDTFGCLSWGVCWWFV